MKTSINTEFIKSPCTHCKNKAICKYCNYMDEFVTNILKLYGESTEDTLPKCEMDIKCEHFSQITYSDHAVNIASKIPQTDTKFDKSAVPIFTKAFTESIEDLNAPISDEEDSVKTKTDAIIDEINSIGENNETTPINKPQKNGSHATPPKPTDTPPEWFRPFDYYGKIVTYAEAYSLWSKGLIDYIPGGGSYSPNFIIK